jgi:hypothetical protein
MKNGNGSRKAVEKYIGDQLKIINKFGTPVKLSNKEHRTLVAKVSKASAR